MREYQTGGLVKPGVLTEPSSCCVYESPLTTALVMVLRSHLRPDYDECGEILAAAIRDSHRKFAASEKSLSRAIDG